jgi:chemotaxis protein methyltransferase CheR
VTVDALTKIAELVRAECGIGLPINRLDSLAASLRRVRPGFGPPGFLRAIQHGVGGRALLESLVDEVTVNETYFFRERGQIDAIPWHELRDAAYARGASKLRVWCAACSTGEEAYTLAMSAYDAFGPLPPPVEIVATDIAPSVLVRARGARYRNRSVREIDVQLRARWLIPAGNEWEVAPELRRLVAFSRHNLVQDSALPGNGEPFDLIVCRNVLIYFDAPTSQRVVELLRRSLQPGGRLVLGSADALGETGRALAAITTGLPTRRSRRVKPLASPPPAKASTTAAVEAAEPGDALDADACFVQGIAELERGAAAEAVASLRRALWLDESFGLAAFALGRAHDLAGDRAAAGRAYRRALHALGNPAAAQQRDLHEIAPDDVAAACEARLAALEVVGS